MSRQTILVAFVFQVQMLPAQFTTTKWFIGDEPSNAGMTFYSEVGDPTPQNNRVSLDMSESNVMLIETAVITMHSNGEKILNALTEEMPNGSDLKGNASSMYGSTIVAHPNFCYRYYVFYTQASEDPPPRKIFYSIVDQNIEIERQFFTSKGDVILSTKDTDITPTNVDAGESIYLVQKSMPKLGSWLMMSGRNTNSIYIFDISSNGVSLHRTYSLTDLNLTTNSNTLVNIKFDSQDTDDSNSQLIIAPTDGTSSNNSIGSYNFNRENGELDLSSQILIDDQTTFIYGTAFSPDGSKLYYSDHITKTLRQFDFETKVSMNIGTSPHNGRSGGLKLGPNNKVYWANIFDHKLDESPISALSVIANPNATGLNCNLMWDDYKITSNPLPKQIGALPTILKKAISPSIFMTNEASCNEINGSAQVIADPDLYPLKYQWENGEITANAISLAAGYHNVTITTLDNCTYVDSILISELSDFDLSNAKVTFQSPTECLASDGFIKITADNIIEDSLYLMTYLGVDGDIVTTELQADDSQSLTINNLPIGTYTKLEIASANSECGFKFSENIKLVGTASKPELGSDTTLCDVNQYLLIPSGNFTNYEWSDGSVLNSLEITTSGIYTLKVNDENGCINRDTVLINFADNPEITLPSDINLNFGDSIQLNPVISSNNELVYMWSPPEDLSCINCLDPIAKPTVSKKYSLVTFDTFMCSDSTSVNINVEKFSGAYVPNIFSPNDDGENDQVGVIGVSDDVVLVRSFKVYSRWGEQVFNRNNFEVGTENNNWDGLLPKGPATTGVYVYSVELELADGSVIKQTGDLLLVR